MGNKCILCNTREFVEDNNKTLVYIICKNRCFPSAEIYQYGIDNKQIKEYFKFKGII